EQLVRLLHELPVGLNEWAVHPGLEDAELLTIEPNGAPRRQVDLDFLVSARARGSATGGDHCAELLPASEHVARAMAVTDWGRPIGAGGLRPNDWGWPH